MGFVANFIRFPAMQEMSKSVKIWQSYREYKGGNFFETQCSLVSPTGSFITGVPEVEMARATTSLMAWCLAILLGACLHTRPCSGLPECQ